MKPAAWRLVVTAVLFLAWVGYLAYLALMTRNPVVLSRPQILVSDLDVVAEVPSTAADADIVVKEVLYPKERPPVEVGQKLHVLNLALCKRLPREPQKGEPQENVSPDFTGPGLYLLPLRQVEGDKYEVVPTPPSPGYPPNYPPDARRAGVGPPRIYPASPEVLRQYKSIPKP